MQRNFLPFDDHSQTCMHRTEAHVRIGDTSANAALLVASQNRGSHLQHTQRDTQQHRGITPARNLYVKTPK